MKKYLIFLFGLFAGVSACDAQKKQSEKKQTCTKVYDSTLKQTIYTWADKMPRYKNGEQDMVSYFSRNFHYPENQKEFQGSVNVEFIVTTKGDLEGIRIMNKLPKQYTAVDKEALRVYSSMPKWTPGSCEGKVVPVKMIIPVKF